MTPSDHVVRVYFDTQALSTVGEQFLLTCSNAKDGEQLAVVRPSGIVRDRLSLQAI